MSKKIVAIACSTGGPRALQEIIPKLPAYLNSPVIVVQHMPDGFTKSLADRLNTMSDLEVLESVDGELIKEGIVYIAKAGKHLNIINDNNNHYILHSDETLREGVKPCANYMYESLIKCKYDEIICVVLTGMGADGAEGIAKLALEKNIKILIQDEESSIVYGMPGSIIKKKLDFEICNLNSISNRITELLED